MNLCGLSEGRETPKALPISSQSRPPPSPLTLSITPSELQTPRSTKGDTLGVTATPSPALLNPLTHEFWNESPRRDNAPIFCPRLDAGAQSYEPVIQRLQSGFRVNIHDGSCPKGRVVEIRLSEDRSVLYVVDDAVEEKGEREDDEEKNPIDVPSDSQLLHSICINDIVRVDDAGGGFSNPISNDVDLLTCFSILTKASNRGCCSFDFECISMKQREAIVSALRDVSKGEGSLRMRRQRLPSFRQSSSKMHAVALSLSVTQEAVLSPMKRTRIYADSDGAIEQGTELALYRTDGNDSDGNEVMPRRKSAPADPFSFSEVSREQSLDGQQDALEASSSMLAASFQEALDEWCSEDGCLDLTEMSESLEGIFFILESQKQVESTNDESHPKHERGDSSDMQVANLCVTDFLSTPASIWNDLPSPITHDDDKQSSSTRSTRKLCNRAGVANAQAFRWRELQTEMRFQSIDHSDAATMAAIPTTKSLDDLDGTEGRVASSQRIASKDFTNTSGYGLFELFPPGLWGSEVDPFLDDEDCRYYDSEPECSRMLSRRKGPRRVQAERLHESSATEAEKRPRLDFSLPRYLGYRFDDEYANRIIDIMKSEQLPLLWHPTPSKVLANRAPRCVVAWIERGTYLLTQTFIQPKLMWRPAREMNLASKRLNVASEAPERVDLLEISRVHESPIIDRQRFPFANKSRSFVIETQSEVHLFEAQTEHDKKRIVFGLKLTISRLASLIMTRDTRAVDEFFEPAAGVPGEAPAFATGRYR